MPFGTPIAGAGDAFVGRIPGRVPAVPVAYRNVMRFGAGVSPTGGNSAYDIYPSAPWTASNATVASTNLDFSPTGFTRGYTLTDTSAVANGFFSCPSQVGGFLANSKTCAQVFIQLNPASAATFRLQYAITGGGGPITASVDIAVATGQVLAQVAPGQATITITQSTVADGNTWLQISIRIDDDGGNNAGTITLFPDVSAGGTGSTLVLQPAIYAPLAGSTVDVPDDALLEPLPFPTWTPTANTIVVQEGKVPLTVLDRRIPWITIPGGAPLFDPDVHRECILVPPNPGSGSTFTLGIPRLNFRSTQQPIPEGAWFILDIASIMSSDNARNFGLVSQGANPTLQFQNMRPVTLSATPLLLTGNQNVGGFDYNFQEQNVFLWLFVASTNSSADWIIYPIGAAHGRRTFAANGNFPWPTGARTLWITAAAPGGGGAGGASGGGGGSGAALQRSPITPFGIFGGVNRAVVIGAAGAAGAAGAPGGAGGVVQMGPAGADVNLAGGLGGLVGGAGGAAGGAGGMQGSPAFTALGGMGGGNIAAGIGGMPTAGAGVAGQLGGGGSGGFGAADAGGAGGPGFLTIEW